MAKPRQDAYCPMHGTTPVNDCDFCRDRFGLEAPMPEPEEKPEKPVRKPRASKKTK